MSNQLPAWVTGFSKWINDENGRISENGEGILQERI
jgi:hypothetical protein